MIDLNKALRGQGVGEVKSPQASTNIVGVYNALDTEAAKQAFAVFEDEIQVVKLKIEALEVKTDEDVATLTETVGIVKKLLKRIDESRKATIKDADKFVREINKFIRPFKVRLESLERQGKQKIGDYNYRQEIERRKAEKKMQQEAAQRQAAIDAEAKAAGVESVKLPDVKLPKRIEPTRTETATASTRYKLTYEVVDFAQIPEEFKTIDHKKLKAAIEAGMRPAGVRIKKEPVVSIRTS